MSVRPLLLVLATLPAVPAQDGLAPAVISATETLLAGGEDPRAGHDALWRACCAEHGAVQPLVAYLEGRIADRGKAAERTRARRLLARVQRRAGELEAASGVLDAIPAAERTVDDDIARAEIRDALGRDAAAAELYGALLQRDLAPATRKKILLRRALMGSGTDGLAAFAKDQEHPADLRNEAAIALALRGDTESAVATFTASGEGTPRFRQEIRRAEWAMDGKDFDAAQAAAWQAVEQAKVPRDRRYALSVLASAYRRDKAVGELLQRFEQAETMNQDLRVLWVRLLREEGRAEDALRLFNRGDRAGFDAQMRRQLLEICRETGKVEVLVEAFRRLIAEEPDNLEWRSGLSRHFLEQGERAQAVAVWSDIDKDKASGRQLMATAHSLQAIGLDEVARQLAQLAATREGHRSQALLFVFQMHMGRGEQDAALKILADLAQGDPSSSVQAEIADGYNRLGRADLAVQTLETLRASLGGFLGNDLEMKLAIQLSRVNREDEALAIWRQLWSRLRATPRGRFIEDRLMTVAARTGALAKIAIELEDRLEKGEADAEAIELLVRLYIKVGDPASATEIIEEFMKRVGSGELELLRRKAKIYLACQDYHHYEQVIQELVAKDSEGRLDHLRELAMSQLERGRRDLTVALLPRIREVSGGDASAMADEFEAGVFGLCGMKEEALRAYVRGMGRQPGRIDTYLLISNLMRETGKELQAARMFQYLAQTADRDDLFTIAIDGILNLRAERNNRVPDAVVHWALRTTLERLARRPDKFYLYRLVTDIAEELNDMRLAIRTLKSGLPVAGERRTATMREIMTKARALDPSARRMIGPQQAFKPSKDWDATDYVMVGRRLLGQGDHVPPQTFMDLATVFLREDDVEAAVRTFNRAAEMLEYTEVLREAARVLEDGGRPKFALQYYRRLLASGADDVNLILKIGTLHEQMGERETAFGFYRRGLAQVLDRKPRYVTTIEETKDDPRSPYRSGNVSIDAAALPRFVEGLVLTGSADDMKALLDGMLTEMRADLSTVPRAPGDAADRHTLAHYPRLRARSEVWRRLLLDRKMHAQATEFDRELLERFAADREVSLAVLGSRAERGLAKDAVELLLRSPFAKDADVRLAAGVIDTTADSLGVAAVARLLTSHLGDPERLRDLLERVDTGSMSEADQAAVPALIAACVVLGARNAGERFARAGTRHADPVGADAMMFTSMLGLAGRLSPALAQSLLREKMTALAATKPASLGSFLFQFGEIDAALGGGTISSAAAKELLLGLAKGTDQTAFYYATTLLGYVDAEERRAVLKEVHNTMPRSQRMRLLLDCVYYFGGQELGAGFLEWYGLALKDALEAGGNNVLGGVSFRVMRSGPTVRSPELTLCALDVLDKFQPNPRNVIERVDALLTLGRRDEALATAEASISATVSERTPVTYIVTQLITRLHDGKLDAEVSDMLGRLRGKHEGNRYLEEAWWRHLQTGDPARCRRELEAALAARPDDTDVLNRLSMLESREGYPVRAARLLERMLKRQPGNASTQRRLESLWTSLKNPVRAAAVGGARRTAARPGGRRPLLGRALGRAVRSAAGASSVAPPGREDPLLPAPVQEVLKLHEAGKTELARQAFRRHWRNFQPLSQYVQFPRNIAYYSRSPDAPVRTIFGRLEKELPFVPEEARAALALIPPSEQYGITPIREELLDIVARDLDRQGLRVQTIHASVASLLAGTAGTDEVEVLLRLLEVQFAATDQGEVQISEEIAKALVSRTEPAGAPRLKRLARLFVKRGEPERAAQLYRLSVLTGSASMPPDLLRESKEIEALFGEHARPLLLQLVDDLSIHARMNQVITWANTAVEIWNRLLPPKEAAERMLQMRTRVRRIGASSPYLGTQTPHGDLVAATLARAGMYDAALQEVESWLRTVPEGSARPIYRVQVREEKVATAVLDAKGAWQDRAAWLRLLVDKLAAWQAAGELKSAVRILGAAAMAAHEVGATELALQCVDAMGDKGSTLPVDRLVRADALRRIERVDAADAIEDELFAEDALPVDRIPAVIARVIARDGAEAGLRAGAGAAEYTLVPELLELLAATAEKLGRADEAARWRGRLAEVEKLAPRKAAGKAEAPRGR